MQRLCLADEGGDVLLDVPSSRQEVGRDDHRDDASGRAPPCKCVECKVEGSALTGSREQELHTAPKEIPFGAGIGAWKENKYSQAHLVNWKRLRGIVRGLRPTLALIGSARAPPPQTASHHNRNQRGGEWPRAPEPEGRGAATGSGTRGEGRDHGLRNGLPFWPNWLQPSDRDRPCYTQEPASS